MSHQIEPRIPLPKGWNRHVRSAVLHVISLAQFAVAYTRGWTGDGHDAVNIVNVVILHAAGRTIGLCVDELFGSADIVVKSLSDNFTDIRGLSGASIMGDGTVCLMFDISEVIKMATEPTHGARASFAR